MVPLGEQSLFERTAWLVDAMHRAGGELWCLDDTSATLTFAFHVDAFDKPVMVHVRIMLNQWDVMIHGPMIIEEGHAEGGADSVARWAVCSSMLGPRQLPPCIGCGNITATYNGEGDWLCFLCRREWEAAG